jgi:hypothetical protein
MRLSAEQIQELKLLALEEGRAGACWRLFGAHRGDSRKGGDVDLLPELASPAINPAPLAARMAARAIRILAGRKVGVLLAAPNLLRLPIHEVAFREVVEL